MICKFTSMSLALVAVMVMGAVMGSDAMAAEFHAGATSTALSGYQTTTNVFTIGSEFSSIGCTTATFSGTTSATSTTQSTQTITPTYAGCKDSLGRTVDVSMNGCDYLIHASGTADIQCPTGQVITRQITNSSGGVACDVAMAAQNGINGLSYSNGIGANGTPDLTVTMHATNIAVTTTNISFLGCGVPNGAHTASIDGTITIEGSRTISFG